MESLGMAYLDYILTRAALWTPTTGAEPVEEERAAVESVFKSFVISGDGIKTNIDKAEVIGAAETQEGETSKGIHRNYMGGLAPLFPGWQVLWSR